MLKRLHFHGALKKLCPHPVEIVADTVWEALDGVTRQIKAFAPDARLGRKRIQVVGFDTIESLNTPSEVEDIHILPAMTFGKEGGLLQTIVGVVLIVASFFIPGSTPFFTKLATALFASGTAMIIGGVMQMLSPVPQLNGQDDEKLRSRYLPGIQNTVRIGTTIPVLYGRRRVGGHILSLNIDAKDTAL